ncbi:MAG: MMPL family transporter, partial [Gemmatimonadaceae bacterium]
WWVLAAWAVAFIALAPLAGRLERELEVTARVRGSEVAEVERLLQTRFNSPFARFAVLVITGAPSLGSEAGEDVLFELTSALDTLPGVSGSLSYFTGRDSLLRSGAGTFVVVGLTPTGQLDAMVPRLRALTEPIGRRLRERWPALTLRWTGDVAINYDIRVSSAVDARRAEQRVLPLTLVLLFLASGAVLASLLPVLTASVAIVISLGIGVAINTVWPLSVLLQNIVSMIGLGVGIDYALLTVSRFRERLADGASAEDAAVDAGAQAGVTIVLSGLAVMIGFGALLFVSLNELQSTGAGGVIVVGVSVLMAVTALPAALAVLGARVDAGRVRTGRAASNPMEHWWRRWGRWVIAHPWLVLVAGSAPLVALSWQARRLSADLPRGNWLPPGMESGLALEDLLRMERSGLVNSLRLVLTLPDTVRVTQPAGWSAARRLTAALATDPRVMRAQSITSVVASVPPPTAMMLDMAPIAKQSLVSADERLAAIDVVPRDSVDFNSLTRLARDLRHMDIARVTGLTGARLLVGGLPAFNADYIDAINARFRNVVLLVVLATLAGLMVGFRSVLVPVKALALNLLSVASAYGAIVVVMQEGHGARWLGLSGPLDAVFPAVPILVFCTVFGLSMDYEVFLVARVAEARRTLGEDDAIVEGLARTGGVITSAAAIMIAVFAAFTLGDFIFIKVLGLALATAVFVDATLVRMAIGPALLKLAGRWNWWPGR